MNNEFPSPPEEVQRLARELELLRSDFQSALSKLNQMDKRLRASFPNLPKKKSKERHHADIPASSKTGEQLLAIFDELVALKRENRDSEFETRLRNLAPEDVIALVTELGAGKGKNTTVKAAQIGIRGRVNETILLNQNRQVADRPEKPTTA
jgi:hypothetical protein